MFSPPSQGLPASLGDVAEPDQREVGGDLSGLAKRVSAYLARVVGALADFEDRLLTEDGFFAREEHFEAQIDSLRREFEHNRRAQLLFARADAVGLLIAQLVACLTPSAVAAADLHSRRQQQFVFAASVLLTSSTSVRTLREHPALIERLWALVSRRGPLDPVQLQYWCRVAGVLLLRDCGGGVAHAHNFAAGLAPRIPLLLRHVYSDSVCTLVKCLLGLPIGTSGGSGGGSGVGSGSPGATTVPAAQPLPLHVALSGEHSLLPACVDMVLSDGDGANNAAELLCTICTSLAERPDALELCGAFVQSFTPLLVRVFQAALTKGATGRVHALRVAASALRMEWQCSALMEEAHAWLPAELLGGSPATSPFADERRKSPFARLILPRLEALTTRLQCDRSLEQVKTAELFSTLLETAPLWTHDAICACNLLEAAVLLFLSPDRNGGGRQDFVRHLILRGLRAALGSNGSPPMHEAIIVNTDLTRRLLRGLHSSHKLRSGKEYVKLLYLELASASERDQGIYVMLAADPQSCWAELGEVVARGGFAPSSQSAPDSPLLTPPTFSSARPPSPSPAELVYIEEDLDCNDDADLPRTMQGESAAVDAENIDPNSPPTQGKRTRVAGSDAPTRSVGTPRPVAADRSASSAPLAVTLPQSPPPLLAPHHAMPSTPPSKCAPSNATHNGTPRPEASAVSAMPAADPRPASGTPRPDGMGEGEGSPFEGADGAHSPSASSLLGYVENFGGGGGGGDTPQPRLVRRAYLHRRAKERFGSLTPKSSTNSPSSPGKSPASPGRGGGLFSGGSLASFMSRTSGSSPSSSPKRDRQHSSSSLNAPSGSPLVKEATGALGVVAAEDEAEDDGEDPAISQLRSSVRSLCF